MKQWRLKRTKVRTKDMAKALQIQEATACVLANRGIGTYENAVNFLYGKLSPLPDEILQMKDFENGIHMLKTAVEQGKKIAIYGDYDVDGVMSTTILYKALRHCNGDVIYYLPHRQKQGYGLNMESVKELADLGIEVLFTCDNGIAAISEVALAKQRGMEVIILDHHEPRFEENKDGRYDVLPCADALIDPKQRECSYEFKQFCAGGLAYRFAERFLHQMGKENPDLLKELLVFAGIATVCDIVDLMGENRILVKACLAQIKESGNIGLQALLKKNLLTDRNINEFHLGFVIGPCINATGRLGSAEMAVSLFCCEDHDKAEEYAEKLAQLNISRKDMTSNAVEKAIEEIENGNMKKDKVLVVYQENTHESIAGIVASRLKEKYYRPVLVITKGENEAKGSARSIEGYHIFQALLACKDFFTLFGGHAMAAGFSLPIENIDKLRSHLNETCPLTENDLQPMIRLEKQLSFDEIDLGLARELRTLAPFGKENAAPIFASKMIYIKKFYLIGKKKDMLRFQLYDSASSKIISGISFDGFDLFKKIVEHLYGKDNCDKILSEGTIHVPLDFAYTIDINEYQGREEVQLMIKDFRLSSADAAK